MQPLETINYRDHEIQIHQDLDNEFITEMLQENDHVFLVYDHRDFYIKKEGFDPQDIFERLEAGYKTYEGYWILPLYAYIHSGVALSLARSQYPFTCPWDTSFRGFVLVERKQFWKKEKAIEVARLYIQDWNAVLRGEVYGYTCEETDMSCWGFIGDTGWKHMIQEAKAEIDVIK